MAMGDHTLYTLNSSVCAAWCSFFSSTGRGTGEFQPSAFELTRGDRDPEQSLAHRMEFRALVLAAIMLLTLTWALLFLMDSTQEVRWNFTRCYQRHQWPWNTEQTRLDLVCMTGQDFATFKLLIPLAELKYEPKSLPRCKVCVSGDSKMSGFGI